MLQSFIKYFGFLFNVYLKDLSLKHVKKKQQGNIKRLRKKLLGVGDMCQLMKLGLGIWCWFVWEKRL